MGFNQSVKSLAAIFDGTVTPSHSDYDLIAHCLNERLTELGLNTFLPYCEEIDI